MEPAVLVILVLVLIVGLVAAVVIRTRGGGESVETAPGLGASLRRIWSRGLDAQTWAQIEEALLAADVGVEPTTRIVEAVSSQRPGDVETARRLLAEKVRAELAADSRTLDVEGAPAVVLVVGVNGSGKTTTIAKLAERLTSQGKSVLLAGADTFRAAAGEQLRVWGDRVRVPVVTGQEGADPGSVVFDSISSARAKDIDVVIVDTAGRLHSKRNLMDELAKIHRVAGGEPGVDEVLLVLDASAGQNGLAQVNVFAETVPVTGLVLAKLDGTAKGGFVVAAESHLGIPIKLVGTGEGLDDLAVFDPDRFVSELLGET